MATTNEQQDKPKTNSLEHTSYSGESSFFGQLFRTTLYQEKQIGKSERSDKSLKENELR